MMTKIAIASWSVVAALMLSATSALAVDAQAAGAANVRSGPGTAFGVVDTLAAGEPVDVVQCNTAGTWCRIEHSGPDGWVARSLLAAARTNSDAGSKVEFGMTFQLPGGGSITLGTPGYYPPMPPPMPSFRRGICVFDLAGYRGASTCFSAGTRDRNINGYWNNRISSLRVFGGAHVQLCQNSGFGGFCNTFSNNVPVLGTPLNNRASSYRVW